MIMEKEVLLVGTGKMARHYLAVLQALGITPTVIGRSEAGAERFTAETGVHAHSGGVRQWKKRASVVPARAIIAVNPEELANTASDCLRAGCTDILLEKPGALFKRDLVSVGRLAKKTGSRVHIAYNRRYLASVLEARSIIEKDGGVTSFSFTFTERVTTKKTITDMGTSPIVISRWFIANSTHVVDLAFYLGGLPEQLQSFTAAGPVWTPHPSLFAGSGITASGVPFSYFANWELPGPWSIEVGTSKRKLILAPLETLRQEVKGIISDVPFDNALDTKFKPGLYRQVQSFLHGTSELPTLEEQIAKFDWYEKMLG